MTPEKWHAFEAGIIKQQVLPRGYSEIYEKEYRRKDGTIFPIELRTVLIRNSAGEPTSMWAIVRDITERKRVEEALRTSEAKFRRLIEASPVAMGVSDAQGNIEYLNPRFTEQFGYRREDIPHIEEWFARAYPDPAYRRDMMNRWIVGMENARLKGADIKLIDANIVCRDGSVRVVEVKGALIGDKTLAIFNDITERKQAEAELRRHREHLEEMISERTDELALTNRKLRWEIGEREHTEQSLRQSEARLHLALEVANAGVWEWNVRTDTITWSPEMFPLFGLQRTDGQSIFEDWAKRLHPDDRERVLASVQNDFARKNNLATYKEYRIVRVSGEVRWISDAARVFYDSAGQPERMVGINIDITQRKQAEEELKRSEARLRLALQAANAGVWDWDLQNDVSTVSKRFFEILGMDAEASPMPLATLLQSIHPKDRAWAESQARELVEHGEDMDLEFRIVRPDGEIRWIQDFGTLVHDAEGRPQRMIGTMIDITERKKTEFELKNYRDHLEMLVGERTAALGATNMRLQQEIAERERVEEKIKTSLQEKEVLLKEIHHRVKNNLQVINSLLDLQAGAVGDPASREKFRESRDRVRSMALIHERLYRAADLASIDFVEYVKSLVDSLLLSYASANRLITLQTNIEPLSISVEHAVPCGLIINELITNALKYAFPQGGIGIIGVELKMLGEEGRVMLRIWDNGVGLPSSIDPRQSETLGLTIVATLVRQLRGDLTLQRVRGSRIHHHVRCPAREDDTIHFGEKMTWRKRTSWSLRMRD